MTSPAFPRIRPVGDSALLVEFGETIDPFTNGKVAALDRSLAEARLPGVVSSTPAYASLLIDYDPLVSEPNSLLPDLHRLAENATAVDTSPAVHNVPVCYDPPFAPDLAQVAEACGLTPEAVIAAHLASRLRVYMYGFAPGMAYLGGLDQKISIPRRTKPVGGVPEGSVIIAGPQCIVTTFPMSTGWWIIGRSPLRIFTPEHEVPVLFRVGDEVRFTRVERGAVETPHG